MQATFDDFGVYFDYPDNWTLGEPEHGQGHVTLSVTSPGTAFWTVSIYSSRAPLEQLLDEVVQTMRGEYRDLDVSPADQLPQRWGAAEHEFVGYDMNFYCLDLTNTAFVRGVRTAAATYVLFCQAADLELTEVEPVFRAMTASLLRDQVRRSAVAD